MASVHSQLTSSVAALNKVERQIEKVSKLARSGLSLDILRRSSSTTT